MPTNPSLKTPWPWLAALAVLLVAWFVPLPASITGADQLAGPRMPQTRASVEATRPDFLTAQESYLDYVKSHDMTRLRADVTFQLASLKAQGGDSSTATTLSDLLSYTEVLQRYATAGEAYYDTLKHYDDDLMAWSRSLGPASESLRDDTFPIVEHLKLYPPPIGETADPPYLSAAQVVTDTASLEANLQKLRLQSATSPEALQQLVDALIRDTDNIWSAGRSIEHIESLHDQYYTFLQTYDRAVQTTISQGNITTSPSPLALTLDLLVGALALAGIGILFLSGWHKKRQEAPG